MRKRVFAITLVCALTLALDRLTKILAERYLYGTGIHVCLGDTIRLEYTENPGAFLSLGAGLSTDMRIWLLTIAVGALLLAIGWVLVRKDLGAWTTVALSLLLSGGVGNWIDRAFRPSHTVVDFLNFGVGELRTGILNVADMAITAGVIILLAQSFLDSRAKAATTDSESPRPPRG